MLEPNTFPIETPTFAGLVTANTATLSSGSEVEKPTRMKPMVEFPKPVISETLREFLIVTSLPITSRARETSKMRALPPIPNCSNNSISPLSFSLKMLLIMSMSGEIVTGQDYIVVIRRVILAISF
jgi:hypothetical protein